MHIDHYTFGQITINGETYTHDVIVFAEEVRAHWWRESGHSLALVDLGDVFTAAPAVLVVGQGASRCMDIPAATKKALKQNNITLIADATPKAVALFNDYSAKGENVVGAFHLTC